jgi:hypothetical protein
MTPGNRLVRLTRTEWALLARTGFVVAVVRLLLVSRPWSSALRSIRRFSSSLGAFPGTCDVSVERLAWAVRTASRVIPGATCLTQAIALQTMLTTTGRSGRVQLGVTKGSGRRLQGHAWVEHEGQTLLSTSGEVAHYRRMLTLEAPCVGRQFRGDSPSN